jgi:molybdopterin-guanine dinucleotide biosynthesis protein A
MGRDKAELEVGGCTLLERALGVARTTCDEVLLAAGPSPRYVDHGVRVILDRAPDLGPLAGLEAALDAARAQRVLFLAVDMPAVEADLARALFDRAERDDCDALLLRGPGGVEPLCGVYHVRVLPAVRAALDAGERRMVALFTHALADGRRARLDVFDPAGCGGAEAARNVNTTADLERARAEFDGERIDVGARCAPTRAAVRVSARVAAREVAT